MLNNLRDSLKPTLQKIGKIFAATGLSPNVFTGIGLALAFVASIVYGIGTEYSLIIGGLALLASGFFDIVDGQVARYTNKMSKSGGFLDSVFDKIAEVQYSLEFYLEITLSPIWYLLQSLFHYWLAMLAQRLMLQELLCKVLVLVNELNDYL